MYCTLMLLPREVAVVCYYALSILSMQSMHATTLVEYKKYQYSSYAKNGLGAGLTQVGFLTAFLAWGDDTLTAFGKTALVGLLAHSKKMFASPDLTW